MTPADRRITELIDKWLTSVDLHLKYAELSDGSYARAQPWPKHDRPTRWVLEVARQKILELKSHCETRQAMGDSKYSESLELMAFLSNLVGIQNIQRFIPLADPGSEGSGATTTNLTLEATVIKPVVIKPAAAKSRPAGDDTTREMPRLKPAAPTARPAAPAAPPRREPPKTAASRPAPAKTEAPARAPSAPTDLKGKIIADAIRLLKWGKSWHELADLIGRIADRPPVADIRKVLRAHKAEIESKAAAG
ncbi:MAG TPA: hypothetical protein VGN07_17090 [Steroidobacteraceae bacterium]|jgi:hypothetical protein